MKRHPIIPYHSPKELDDINLDTAETNIHNALAKCPGLPLHIRPRYILDDKRLFKGRPRMIERQEVKIEEIGDEL